jgi:pyroglutamyl-peptidase
MAGAIIVTGFEPFGGEKSNASWDAVRLLPDEICGREVRRLKLPVVFGASGDMLASAMREEAPSAVVCVGEAAGRTCLTPERVAVNRMDARIPDNNGARPLGECIVAGGPDAYLSTLPVCDLVCASCAVGVPAKVSDTAGLYVCNQVMYRALHEATVCDIAAPCGFVHVPYTPAQTVLRPEMACMPSELASVGLAAMIEAALVA